MILPLLLLLACPQDPGTQDQGGGSWKVQVAQSTVETEGDEILYHISALILDGPGRAARADLAELRLDRVRYEAALAGKPLPPGPERPGRAGRLAGRWLIRLLGGLGLPEDPALLRELVLEGHVLLQGEGLRLRCSRLAHNGAAGTTEVLDADLLLGDQGPNGWPARLLAGRLEEDADGALHTSAAALTTCDRPIPHYSVRLDRLDITPLPEGETLWSPQGAWLEIGGTDILPLPASDFQSGESSFGLQGLRLFSNSALGSGIEPEFGWHSAPTAFPGGLEYDLGLLPALSTRRGLPVRATAGLRAGAWRGDWELFWLADRGSDRHRLADRVARGGDQRWRVRLDNRLDLGDRWLLDADLALTSDALVDPEFFGPDWRREDDARSELYLRRSGDVGFAEAWATGRLDDSGFTPFDGFPVPGTPAPRQLEMLPRIRYERFPETLAALPLDWAGAETRILPLDVAWGGEVALLRQRNRELATPAGVPAYSVQPAVLRQRARAWAEASTSFSAAGVFVRPGYRVTALAYDDDLAGTGGAERGLGELFVETGMSLVKDWEHGWRHQILPQLRFRDRRGRGLDPSRLVQFDDWDALAPGQALELSLRQFYFAPDGGEPWLDLDLLLPWYPDPGRPLVDPIFPAARPGHGGGRWGPAELRMTWTPGVYGRTLEGVRLETRMRQDLDEGRLDELFTRLSIRPHERLRYGASLYRVDDRFSLAEFDLDWRFTDEWGIAVLAPWTFTGAPNRNSSLAIRRYFHDLMVEVGVSRSSADGRSGVFFNIAPRFLVDRRGPLSSGSSGSAWGR